MSEPQTPQEPQTNVSSGESTHCGRCKRPLKNPIYRKIGMGKICLSKSNVPNKLELLKQVLDEEKKKRDEKKSKPEAVFVDKNV